MNTPEKYICAYIVESLTGIQGSSHDRVIEVLKNSDFSISDPFLRLIYDIARYNPESQKVKDEVAGLVVGHTVLSNKFVQNALAQTVKDMVKNAKPSKEEKGSDVTLCYTKEGENYAMSVWFGTDPKAMFYVHADIKDAVIEKFRAKFPEGKVVTE